MRCITYSLFFLFLCQACDKKHKVDWREKYEGNYVGQGKLRSWIFEREDSWLYQVDMKIERNPDMPDKLIIKRNKVGSYYPNSIGYSYFQTSLGLFGLIDSIGLLTIPSQQLRAENEFASVTVAETKLNVPTQGSYGKFAGDSLVLVIAYANKDMRDSVVVHRR